MTAQVVPPAGPYYTPEDVTHLSDADRCAPVATLYRGQLWERLAEQEVVPTARLGAALIRADVRGEAR